METEHAADIGCQLREARKSAGLTQAEVAAAVGRSRPTIAAWEAGRTEPDLRTFGQLSQLYGAPADQLLGAEPAEPPEPTVVRLKRVERQLSTLRADVYKAHDHLRGDGLLPA